MEARRAREAEQANTVHSQAILDALVHPKNSRGISNASILSLLADPYVDPTVHQAGKALLEANLEAAKPFTIGHDRVAYDPATGKAALLYQAPEDFESYAQTLGFQPGTPEYFKAAEDYVLRANGPTALQNDQTIDDYRTANDRGLENLRQDNRVSLENLRQGNRVSLHGAPTYRDTHSLPPTYHDLHPTPRTPSSHSSARPTATGPNGEQIQWNGSAWVDANGKPVK
jgi:hypothetical protein